MKPHFSIWLFGLLFSAFALRLFQLEIQSIWWDEGISLHLASADIPEIVRDRLNNIHPPLYFIGLKSWLLLSGVNVFSARYLSVLAGWLQVVTIFAVAHRWFSLRTAYVAGVLATISAVSVVYSQEVRVYALLPLIYLALLAITRELTRQSSDKGVGRTGLWLSLGLVTWLALHLHYIALFVVLYVAAWALIIFIKQKCWLDLRNWILIQFMVLLGSLPWFIAVISNWAMVRGEANAGTFVSEPVPLRYLVMQVWTFQLTGLAGMLARPGASGFATILAGLLAILLILRLVQIETRKDTAALLSHWLVPLCSALVVWTVRSFSHPRYLAIFVPGLLMLTGYLIKPPKLLERKQLARIANILSGLLFFGLIAASLWGLLLYFFDPDVAKEDMRGVARYLESKAENADLILVPDTNWSLSFEYSGSANVAMPQLDNPDGGWSNLARLTENRPRVFVVDYVDGTRDWQGRLPFALEAAGSQMTEVGFEGLEVRSYMLEEPIAAPHISPISVNFEPLVLTGAWIEQDESAGDTLAIALTWQLSELMEEDVNVAIRLLDEQEWMIASTDLLLRDENGRPTGQWNSGKTVTTYHTIQLPQAIPPLAYKLGVQVYSDNSDGIRPLDILDDQGAPKGLESVIGITHMAYKPSSKTVLQESLPIVPQPEPLYLAPGLSLLAAEVQDGGYSPGDRLLVQILWQATESPLADLQPELALVQGSRDLDLIGGAPSYGQYPTNLWSLGEMVYERRQLKIPVTISGKAQVVLRLGEKEVVIGEVEVLSGQHIFDRVPVMHEIDAAFGDIARLTGFNIRKEQFSIGEPVPLTLVWQSTTNGSDTDYVVFAHLLAEDGHLIGQHDGPPANGSRNVTGWIVDEYVVDHHEMVIKEKYEGHARIEVGIYDPVSGERVLLADGSDRLILPIVIKIAPSQ